MLKECFVRKLNTSLTLWMDFYNCGPDLWLSINKSLFCRYISRSISTHNPSTWL